MSTTFSSARPSTSRDQQSDAIDGSARGSEERLLVSLLAGEGLAWREFQARYDRLIYRCITKVTARFSARVGADDVREIYATLLLQLLANDMHKLRTFDATRGNRFGSWIGLLAINAAYDYLRSVRRDANRASITEAEMISAELPDPHELCERRERALRVAEMLEDFSQKDRMFMELYFGEGLKPEEVAERMNISVKTVYSKKHKIQSRLEALMGKEQLAALRFGSNALVRGVTLARFAW